MTTFTVNIHVPSLVGTSVQVTLVWLVVVGQLPQFDARMSYLMAGHSGAISVHLKVISLDSRSASLLIFGGRKYSGNESNKTMQKMAS